jgi:putative ABC transport system substrate-binding protein
MRRWALRSAMIDCFRRVVTVVFALLAAPLAADAQPSAKVPRIGYLSPNASGFSVPFQEALRQGLREHGYVDGQNIRIESRNANGNVGQLPELAKELVRLKVDVIVAAGQSIRAAKAATTEIPIVFAGGVGDPVRDGVVASLARPGGNVTGFTNFSLELMGKRLALLKEVLPQSRRIAVLSNQLNAAMNTSQFKELDGAARAMSLELRVLHVQGPEGFEDTLETAKRNGVDAVYLMPDPLFLTHRARVAEVALRSRLPLMGFAREQAEAGALLSYGVSIRDMFRRAGGYVARILRGERPGNLPIQQPTTLELVINERTVKVLALTIPPALLLRADQIIE